MSWSETKPEVAAYLERIGYEGPLDGSASALAGLQHAHLLAVPYENLDILAGVPLSLDTAALWDKIVRRRRGGYCFELNAMFGWLLRELGYPVTDLVARFWRDETVLPPMRRHHVLRVEAEGAVYLCDVGVGGAVPREPLAIAAGLEQPQGEECYRLDRDAQFGWFLSERKRGNGTGSTPSRRSRSCRTTTSSPAIGASTRRNRRSARRRSWRSVPRKAGIPARAARFACSVMAKCACSRPRRRRNTTRRFGRTSAFRFPSRMPPADLNRAQAGH